MSLKQHPSVFSRAFRPLLLALALTSTPVLAHTYVEAPWVRLMPPGSPALAGYFVLVNHNDDPRTLIGASSDAAQRVEVHTHRLIDGVARMERIERLELKAGEKLTFEPGSYHLMLIDPKPLKEGDIVRVQLHFDGHEDLAIDAEVKRMADTDPTGAAHHHHHH